MATEIWGTSDDLIEFRGDVYGEVGCFGTDDRDQGVLVMCSDGTVLEVKYCANVSGVWAVLCKHRGTLFERIDTCDGPDAERYSDTAHFRDGLRWAYAAKEDWERVK